MGNENNFHDLIYEFRKAGIQISTYITNATDRMCFECPETLVRLVAGRATSRDYWKIPNREVFSARSRECLKMGGQYGCDSYTGPAARREPRTNNEDAALATELLINDVIYLIDAVADGVSNSPWSKVGSLLACQVFYETAEEILKTFPDPVTEMDNFSAAFSKSFCIRWKALTGRALRSIQGNHYADPKILSQSDLSNFFQTTLQASILGPQGGIILEIGDGFTRITRKFDDDRPDKNNVLKLPLDPPKGWKVTDVPVLIMDANEALIVNYLRKIPPDGACEIKIVHSTDGIKNSPENYLDSINLTSREDCMNFITKIAARSLDSKNAPCVDNMAVSFCSRPVEQASMKVTNVVKSTVQAAMQLNNPQKIVVLTNTRKAPTEPTKPIEENGGVRAWLKKIFSLYIEGYLFQPKTQRRLLYTVSQIGCGDGKD